MDKRSVCVCVCVLIYNMVKMEEEHWKRIKQ